MHLYCREVKLEPLELKRSSFLNPHRFARPTIVYVDWCFSINAQSQVSPQCAVSVVYIRTTFNVKVSNTVLLNDDRRFFTILTLVEIVDERSSFTCLEHKVFLLYHRKFLEKLVHFGLFLAVVNHLGE